MKPGSLIALAVLAGAVLAGPARAVDIGITGFGGSSIPVVQDDVKKGGTFGVRVPVSLVGMLTVEPFYQTATMGDATVTFNDGLTATRTGYDVKTFGANLLLGSPVGHAGFKFF